MFEKISIRKDTSVKAFVLTDEELNFNQWNKLHNVDCIITYEGNVCETNDKDYKYDYYGYFNIKGYFLPEWTAEKMKFNISKSVMYNKYI